MRYFLPFLADRRLPIFVKIHFEEIKLDKIGKRNFSGIFDFSCHYLAVNVEIAALPHKL